MKNCLRASIAVALLLAAVGASASTLTISPNPASAVQGAGNSTTPSGTLQVLYDNASGGASTVSGLEFEITFDDTDLDLTVAAVSPYSCQYIAASGLITIIGFDAGGVALPSANTCNLTFVTAAGAATGEIKPLAFQNIVASGNNNVAPAATNGVINIIAAPLANPPILTFAPPGGTVVSGGSFTITPSGGQVGGSANYTCTPAGGVVLSNGAGVINTGGAAVAVGATCPAGPDGTVACTHTGFAGSTASPVNFTIDCPVAPAPVLSSSPANGTILTCNGAPGAAVTTQATIQNTGNANMTGVTCNVIGAGFALTTAPTPIIAGGGSSNAVVTCTVPAAGAPTATGTLSCTTTAPAGGARSFPLSSSGQTTPTFVAPDIIPASSLWSKIGLIGLLAALGMLMVGFRRQQ